MYIEFIREFKRSEIYILISTLTTGLGFCINRGDFSIVINVYIGLIYFQVICYKTRSFNNE